MKKALSLLLCFVVLLGCMPMAAFAASSASDSANQVTVAMEASELDANGKTAVKVTITPNNDLWLVGSQLTLVFDTNMFERDLEAGSYSVYDKKAKKDVYYGISFGEVDGDAFAPKNFQCEQVSRTAGTAVAMNFTGDADGFTDQPFDITFHFVATDAAKATGGNAEFKLMTAGSDAGKGYFVVSTVDLNNNKVSVNTLTEESLTTSVAIPITSIPVTGDITTPVKGAADASDIASGTANASVAVVWTPALVNGKFAAETEYKATVTVSPVGGAKFADNATVSYTGNSGLTFTRDGDNFVAEKTFPKTEAWNVALTVAAGTYIYTGVAQEPAVTVKVDGTEVAASNYDLAYTDNIDAGTAKVTATMKGDYAGSSAEGSFTIAPLDVAVTWDTTTPLAYTGSEQAPAATATGVAGETINLTITGKGTDAGSYTATAAIESVTGGQAKAANYNLTGTTQAFTIAKADGTAQTYNVTVPTKGATDKEIKIADLGLDETFKDAAFKSVDGKDGIVSAAALDNGVIKFSTTADVAADATGTITATLSSKNWNDVTLTVNVTAKALEITDADWAKVTTQDVEYGKTNADAVTVPATITVKDALNNEHTATLTLQAPDTVNDVGAVTATVVLEVKEGDYAGFTESHTYNYNVTAKEVAVTWTDTELTYTGAAQKPTAAVTGVNGETIVLTVTGEQTNAGENYTATAAIDSVTGGNAKATNYTLTNATTTFKIAPKALTDAMVSGLEDQAYTGSAIEPVTLKDGDTPLVKDTDYTIVYTDNTNAGTAKAAITGKGNYSGTLNKEFKITKVAATVAADDKSKDYGATDPTLTAVVTGTLGSDTINYTLARAEGEDVGTYAITVTLGENPNYDVTPTGATFTINQAAYTGAALTYDVTVPTKGVTDKQIAVADLNLAESFKDVAFKSVDSKTGIVSAAAIDNGVIKFSTTADVAADAPGTIVVTLSSKNWNDVTLTVNVTAKALEITDADWAKVTTANVEYGKTNAEAVTVPATITVKDALNNEHTATLTLQAPDTVNNVGTATATVKLEIKSGEYTGFTESHDYTYTVTAKEVAVTWTDTELTYTGAAQKPTAAVTGVNGETIALTVTGEQTNAGENYTATAAIESVTGGNALASNYALTNATTTFTIAPAAATGTVVVAADADLAVSGSVLTATVYADQADATAYTYQWTKDGEDISGATAATYTATDDDVNAAIGVKVTFTGNYTGTLTSNTVTPAGAPVFASVAGTASGTSIDVTWSVDANGSAITAQKVTVELDSATYGVYDVAADATSYTITGLTQGKTYTVKVSATNAVGTTDSDTVSVTVPEPYYGGGGAPAAERYKVTVKDTENGTVKVLATYNTAGTEVKVTVTPDEGYKLQNLTVVDANGKEVKVTMTAAGATFVMPASDVTISATFVSVDDAAFAFIDVPADSYFAEAVAWAVKNGITNGTTATTFSPYKACTRAEIVTFLWRAAGCPESGATGTPFNDVDANAYYYPALLWAVEAGITNGISEGKFGPNEIMSRAQMVTFLERMCKGKGGDGEIPFEDVPADAYYADAVLWAVENGYTKGTTDTTFSPDSDCNRAQAVTFLYRIFGK